MGSKVVIHRDRSFEFKGQRYEVWDTAPSTRGIEGDARMVVRINSTEPGDWDVVAEGFMYLSEVRDFVQQAIDNDWPSLMEEDE